MTFTIRHRCFNREDLALLDSRRCGLEAARTGFESPEAKVQFGGSVAPKERYQWSYVDGSG